LHPKNALVDPNLIPEDDREAGGLPRILKVSKGTRIMLIRNINTPEGLVNGAMGYVEYVEIDEHDNVMKIYVLFDDQEVGKHFQVSSKQNSIPIEPISQEYHYNGRMIIREQFPLMPCWACTIHKVQGATLDKAAISLGREVFERGMAYVALSRVKCLSGLYLLKFDASKICPSQKALNEYIRLRNLRCQSAEGYEQAEINQ